MIRSLGLRPLLWLAALVPGCAPAAPPARPGPSLVASLRRGGIALRPESPRQGVPPAAEGPHREAVGRRGGARLSPATPPASPAPPAGPRPPAGPPPAPVPAALRRPEELRLLGGRLGRPPSLSLGCAIVGDTGPDAPPHPPKEALQSCLGEALGRPLESAAVVEQVVAGRVVSVAAEEGFPSATAAEQRFAALKGRLEAALGLSAPRAGQLLFRPRGHELSLELLTGGTSYVTLQLRLDR